MPGGCSAARLLAVLFVVGPPAAHRVGAQLQDVQHLGEDCWGSCGQQQGPCASGWCGTAGMCCKFGFADHSNGCDGTIGTPGSNRHECSATPTRPPAFPEFVSHLGEDCWASCGQQGACAWCGSGMCCNYGYADHSNGCDGTIGTPGLDAHVCGEAPARGGVCDSPLNDAASYASEAAMSAAGWSFGSYTGNPPVDGRSRLTDCSRYRLRRGGRSRLPRGVRSWRWPD